jgi:DNA-binding NarL/FixJ family response regulator
MHESSGLGTFTMTTTEADTVRAFVVEDSEHMQAALGDLYATLGGIDVVGSARSEMEATSWLEDNQAGWNLLHVDLLLAEGSGFNLIARCRKQNEDGVIVVFSDFVTPAITTRCVKMGADAVFSKSQSGAYSEFVLATSERLRHGMHH